MTSERKWRREPLIANESPDTALDYVFFVIGGLGAVWLAYLLFRESFTLGWGQLWFSVVYWILLAYLVLPRLHRILTRIYVPDYFIGRARTSDGLLGDPINLALLGSEAQVHAAMAKAGWTRADDITLASGWRIVTSTILRRSYLEAPVSPLMVFGRQQDFAYQQEVNGTPGKRHHVRFWRCPPDWRLPGGRQAEWLAAGTYDRSVGLSLFTLQVTHKIDANTDSERDHIITTLTAAEPAVQVKVIKDFSTGYHSRNGGGDSIVTDGDLPVLDLERVPDDGSFDEVTDSRDKRPAPTIVGAALVVARGVAAAVLVVALIGNKDGLIGAMVDSGLTQAQLAPLLWIGLFALIGIALAEIGLAVLVFLGTNWARVIVMTGSTISIIGQAVSVATGGPELTLLTNLSGLSLDVLLIIALSSERALTYARRSRKAPKRISGRPGNAAAF